MIKDRLIDSYMQYREKWLKDNWRPEKLQVVVRIKPSTYAEMVAECYKDHEHIMPEFYTSEFRDIMFTRLCGLKTPIILDPTLPEEVEFTIQSRADYERLEKRNIIRKTF